MIGSLNLASDPFRNRVLPWTITAIIACISLVALAWIVSASRATQADAEQASRALQKSKEQTRDIRLRAEALKQEMPAEDLRSLEAAHRLVERKGFAWSLLLTDLEAAIPAGVRVTRISVRDVVETAPEAKLADLGLTVVGRSPSDVTRMIAEMNRGGIFTAIPLTENVQKGQGESGFEWTLRLSYRPRAGRPLAPATEDRARVAQVVEDAATATQPKAQAGAVPGEDNR